MYQKLVLVLLAINSVHCEPCSRIESVNITAGVEFENGSVIYDEIEYLAGRWYDATEENETVRYGCPCIGRACVWKCCGEGQMFYNKTCTPTDASEVNPFRPPIYRGQELTDVDASQRFFYMHNRPCQNRYLVDDHQDGNKVMLQENATLYEIANNKHQWHLPATYCIDMMITNVTSGSRPIALVCHPEDNEDDPVLFIAYAIGLLLSVPFLIATFVVYAFIPELRNLHGMCLMAYCAGLIVAYTLLAYLKLQITNVNTTVAGCMVIAFIIYYAFQTSFFWLNVMCFDIWRTFSGYRGGRSSKMRERRRFALYGLYAWGVPLVLAAFTVAMQFSDLPDNVIAPGFGESRCWFSDWTSEMVYFFIPVLVLVVCNVVLFSVTAHRIRSIRQETAILKNSESSRSDRLKRDKQRYGLYLKLFMVMGVNWTIEVISFGAGGSNWYWVVMDLSNLVLGLFIFFIFVWKNKVRNLVRKKFAACLGKPADGSGGCSESGTGRWATRSSTAATEITRVNSSDDAAGMRLKDIH